MNTVSDEPQLRNGCLVRRRYALEQKDGERGVVEIYRYYDDRYSADWYLVKPGTILFLVEWKMENEFAKFTFLFEEQIWYWGCPLRGNHWQEYFKIVG